MLREDNITIRIESQGYKCESYTVSASGKESVLLFQSQRATEAQRCPACGSQVYVHDSGSITLRDMPIWEGCKQEMCCIIHRYRCTKCGACFTEEVPFQYPGTRITRRAAGWVRELLRGRLSIKAVQEITGIHWDTIHRIHKKMMEEALENRDEELNRAKYKHERLAVDEFAIHKGYTYESVFMGTVDCVTVSKGQGKTEKQLVFRFKDGTEVPITI